VNLEVPLGAEVSTNGFCYRLERVPHYLIHSFAGHAPFGLKCSGSEGQMVLKSERMRTNQVASRIPEFDFLAEYVCFRTGTLRVSPGPMPFLSATLAYSQYRIPFPNADPVPNLGRRNSFCVRFFPRVSGPSFSERKASASLRFFLRVGLFSAHSPLSRGGIGDTNFQRRKLAEKGANSQKEAATRRSCCIRLWHLRPEKELRRPRTPKKNRTQTELRPPQPRNAPTLSGKQKSIPNHHLLFRTE
jgi:hypothetical protein